MYLDPELYPWVSLATITWGVLDCFFGYRFFKFTLGLFGGLVGAWLADAAARQIGAGAGMALTVTITGAVVGAALAFLTYIAAVFLAGFGFGATLGMLLLANHQQAAAVLAGLVLGVVGGFLAVKVQRVLITLSTALLGAFRAVLATTYFTSQLDWYFYIRQPDQFPALIESNGWMLPAILALAAVGVVAQLELGGNGKASRAKDKED